MPGHHNKGKSNTWLIVDNPALFTSRERARKVAGTGPCSIAEIGGCAGRVEVHHVDENPFNNAPENLRRLCTTHHRLVHTGKVDLADPKMPSYRVGSDGKRRYA